MFAAFSRLAASMRAPLKPRPLRLVAAITLTPLCAPVLASETRAQPLLNPAEIDRAVAAFTGAAIGETGGARAPADPRLRLAACAQPLALSWHGTNGTAVRVACPEAIGGTGPWKIFVSTRAATQTLAPAHRTRPAPGTPIIKRGDPVTVVVRGRGFSVQQSGEAMENGHIGDWIGIRTARQADPVRARIERPGLAVIPAS